MPTTAAPAAAAVPDLRVPPPAATARAARGVLASHVLATVLIQSCAQTTALLPVLARKEFGAGNWQTLLFTAAPSTLFLCAIFWQALFARLPFHRAVLLYWLCGNLPYAFASFVHSYTELLVLQLVACGGGAAWSILAGDLLKRLYPDRQRGRVFGILNVAMLAGGMAATYAVGRWLRHDAQAFRIYMPLLAAVQLGGCLMLIRVARRAGDGEVPRASAPLRWSGLVEPILHMNRILRADRRFARYEAAFMTYGVGWMICYALLPLLVTERLRLNYEEIASATQVVFNFCMLLAMLPAGLLIDRIGPVRTSGLSFALLTLYPVGLALARGPGELALASAAYGVMMAGVNMGWMLGPVALAGSPARVPHYVAIHTTLVGLRGTLFQGLGMLLYTLTGSFGWPLAVGAVGFAWASWQMWRLQGPLQRVRPAPAPGGRFDA